MKIFSFTIGWKRFAFGLVGSILLFILIVYWLAEKKEVFTGRFVAASDSQPSKIAIIERRVSSALNFVKRDIFGIRPPKVVSIEHSSLVPGEEIMTRVNFFLAEPIRASLAIPVGWEGRYRLEEFPKKVDFLYLPSALTNELMFSLELQPAEGARSTASSGGKLIKESSGWAVVLVRRQIKNEQIVNDQSYQQINNQVDSVISSLKLHKQQAELN